VYDIYETSKRKNKYGGNFSISSASQGLNFQQRFDPSDEVNNPEKNTTVTTVTKKKRGESKVYHLDQTYETKEQTETVIANERIWSKKKSKDDMKQFTGAKKYGRKQCATGLYLLFHAENLQVSIYRTNCAHTCIVFQD
jgi:hypothetical protein